MFVDIATVLGKFNSSQQLIGVNDPNNWGPLCICVTEPNGVVKNTGKVNEHLFEVSKTN